MSTPRVLRARPAGMRAGIMASCQLRTQAIARLACFLAMGVVAVSLCSGTAAAQQGSSTCQSNTDTDRINTLRQRIFVWEQRLADAKQVLANEKAVYGVALADVEVAKKEYDEVEKELSDASKASGDPNFGYTDKGRKLYAKLKPFYDKYQSAIGKLDEPRRNVEAATKKVNSFQREVDNNKKEFNELLNKPPCPQPQTATPLPPGFPLILPLPGGLGLIAGGPPGLYLGGHLIKSVQKLGVVEKLADTGETTFQSSDSKDPLGAGVIVGAKIMPWSNVVLSPFVSFDYLNMFVNHTFAGGSYLGTTANFAGTAGVKIGPQLDMGLWLYGITGVSVLNEKLNVNFIPVASSTTATVPGATVGVGGAWQPNFLQGFGLPVSLFVEYQHTWWQDANFNTPVASPLFNYNFRREDDVVKFGFTVSLSPPPPAASARPIITK